MGKRLIILLCLTVMPAAAQNVNVDDLLNLKEKKLFKLGGNVSANSTFYDATQMLGRQSFTWQLNGSLNVNVLGLIDIPLSMNLNNFGAQYTYPSPPNRLSLHPSYKWIRAHIGDVSMSFSPYTLSGHLFTGGGVELTPGKWNIAAMGGRLVRKVDYNPDLPSLPPSYERWGMGGKVRYNGTKYFVGGSLFTAKDRGVSMEAEAMSIFPKSNVAAGVEAGGNITKNLKIAVEYGLSYLVRDTRPTLVDGAEGKRRGTERTYHAVKAALDYTFFKNTVGVGYERIDPEYETLGAYYFNNDYENYTLNYARPLFGGKGSVALSGGFQRDDIDGAKQSTNTRMVGSANLAYSPTERVSLSLSGSTFQGYRVIKSQFDYINQTKPYENLDTLNFTQISQSVDFNASWRVGQSHNISLFTSYQESADKQGGYILPGNLNRFLNAALMYGLDVAPWKTNFNVGFNASNSYSNMRNFLTLGPTVAANVKLFKGKVMTGVSVSQNRSYDQSVPMADVFNLRWNANARLFKRHSLQASAMLQRQKRMTPATKSRSFTGQIGYSCSF